MDDIDHKFHALNHFPELRVSLASLIADQETAIIHKKEDTKPILIEKHCEESRHTVDYTLRQLQKSCLSDIPPYLSIIRQKHRLAKKHQRKQVQESLFSPNAQALVRIDQSANNAFDFNLISPTPRSETKPKMSSIEEKISIKARTFDFSSKNESYKTFLDNATYTVLSLEEFSTALKRVFDLWLSKSEMKMLFDHLLKAKLPETVSSPRRPHTVGSPATSRSLPSIDNKLGAYEFIRYFKSLSSISKHHLRSISRHSKTSSSNPSVATSDSKQSKSQLEDDSIRLTFEEAEKKLRGAAFSFDASKFTMQEIVRGFDNFFTTEDLKQRIDVCFNVKLSNEEAVAIGRRFQGRPYEPSVDGKTFVKYFLDLHANTWKEHRKSQLVLKDRQTIIRSRGQAIDFLPKSVGR
jgi:hypothetical protein